MIKYHIDRVSAKPVYIQLKDQLKEAIDDGRLPPLSPMPHVTTIAKEAGVSLRTADNALLELIKDGVCFRRPKKGTFVQVKHVLVKKTVCAVLGCPDTLAYPLESLLYCGIMEAAARKGIMPLLFPVSKDIPTTEDPEALIRRCDRGNEFELTGIFCLNPYFDQAFDLAKKFPEKKIFILCHQFDGYRELLPNMGVIVNDDFSGAYQLAQFIVSEHRPKKAVILTANLKDHNLTYSERCRGFRQALKENSLKPSHLVTPKFCGKKEQQTEGAYVTVRSLLETDPEVDCIFCTNDLFANGAYKAVEDAGKLDQICVTGYDGIHLIHVSEVSTVKVPYTEMGKTGMEKLLDPEPLNGCIIKLPPEIVKISPKKSV